MISKRRATLIHRKVILVWVAILGLGVGLFSTVDVRLNHNGSKYENAQRIHCGGFHALSQVGVVNADDNQNDDQNGTKPDNPGQSRFLILLESLAGLAFVAICMVGIWHGLNLLWEKEE